MLRRSVFLTRRLWRASRTATTATRVVASQKSFCTVVNNEQKKGGGMDDFLLSLAVAPAESTSKSVPIEIFTNFKDVQKIIDSLEPIKLEYICSLLDYASRAETEQENRQKIAQCISNRGQFDASCDIDCEHLARAWLNAVRLDFKQAQQNLREILVEKIVHDALTWNTILELQKVGAKSNDENLKEAVRKTLWDKINEIHTSAELLTVLKLPEADGSFGKLVVAKAIDLLPQMSTNELINLLTYYANLGVRPSNLLTKLPQYLANQKKTIGSNQIVRLASACEKLNLSDARLVKRLCNDIQFGINSFTAVDDVTSVQNSLVRLRVGDSAAWKSICRWMEKQLIHLSLSPLTRFVSGAAFLGIWEARPIAEFAARRIIGPSMGISELKWLSLVHSFAYFSVLTTEMVESVLNKQFIDAIFKTNMPESTRLFYAQRLLQISGCAQFEIPRYKGKLFTFEDLTEWGIANDADTTKLAAELKYSKEGWETHKKEFLDKILSNVVPPNVRQDFSIDDQFGQLVDSFIVRKNKNNPQLLPKSAWTKHSERIPIIYVLEKKTKIPLSANPTSYDLMGMDQLAVRLMKHKYTSPLLIFETELNKLDSTVGKITYLKEAILNSKETGGKEEEKKE